MERRNHSSCTAIFVCPEGVKSTVGLRASIKLGYTAFGKKTSGLYFEIGCKLKLSSDFIVNDVNLD